MIRFGSTGSRLTGRSRWPEAVRGDELGSPTPCAQWTVQQLIDHLVWAPNICCPQRRAASPHSPAGHRSLITGRVWPPYWTRCGCPARWNGHSSHRLGFEWPVSQAVAGTFMDVLIHTWDLARATGQDDKLDPDLVNACAAMFLPDMPERGRAAGIIGPP